MRRRAFSAIALRLCFLSGVLAAAPPGRLAAGDDASELVAKLRKKYDKTASLSASFTQTTVFAVSKARQSSQGTIALAKGNRYRIAYDDRVIVCDGATVWSWSKGNGQVVVDRFREDPNGLTPERLLANLPEEYSASLLAPESIGDAEVEKRIAELLEQVNLKKASFRTSRTSYRAERSAGLGSRVCFPWERSSSLPTNPRALSMSRSRRRS